MKYSQSIVRYLAFVLASAISFPVFAGGANASTDQAFQPGSAYQLLQWAAKLTGRTMPDRASIVVVPTSLGKLSAQVCPDDPRKCRRLMAAYSIEQRKIVYRNSLNPARVLDRSFLVHEFVHYLQHLEFGERVNVSCHRIMANEREAYAAQAAYLRRHENYYPVGRAMRGVQCAPPPFEHVSL